ncbi:MAG TPA: hypothetical protein VIY48_14305 [Candidatus Paceibacterota bacterium]
MNEPNENWLHGKTIELFDLEPYFLGGFLLHMARSGEEVRTSKGVPVSEEMIEKVAEEAEEGYPMPKSKTYRCRDAQLGNYPCCAEDSEGPYCWEM